MLAMTTNPIESWACATLRALYAGESPWWALPGSWLRRMLEVQAVADAYYELAEWDEAAARAMLGPDAAPNALRTHGFEARVTRHMEHARVRIQVWIGAACATLAAAVFVVARPGAPPGDDAFAPRGNSGEARVTIDVLCMRPSGERVEQLDSPRIRCAHDGVVQPLVTNTAASTLRAIAFVVQTGPADRIVPMVPNPAETDAFQLQPIGVEQRIGPARRLDVHYEPAPGYLVVVLTDVNAGWIQVEQALEEMEGRAPGANLRAAAAASFTEHLGSAPRIVLVRPFDITPATP